MEASSPSNIPTTDITRVYDIPNTEFRTEKELIKWYGFDINDKENIGSGAFVTVYKAVKKDEQLVLAVKVMEISGKSEHKLKTDAKSELFVMEKTSHPHIIKLFDHFIINNRITEKNRVFLFMQFAENGSLSQYLRKSKQTFDETKAKTFRTNGFGCQSYAWIRYSAQGSKNG